MAAQFCLNWLNQNRTENEATFGHSSSVQSIDTSHQVGGNEPTQPDEIIFENTDFKLIVKTDQIRRSHRFQIVDRQFNLLIVPKTDHEHPPLMEILEFLEDGFNAILAKIKTFVDPTQHRIAYLTLYQEPMVRTLNSYFRTGTVVRASSNL